MDNSRDNRTKDFYTAVKATPAGQYLPWDYDSFAQTINTPQKHLEFFHALKGSAAGQYIPDDFNEFADSIGIQTTHYSGEDMSAREQRKMQEQIQTANQPATYKFVPTNNQLPKDMPAAEANYDFEQGEKEAWRYVNKNDYKRNERGETRRQQQERLLFEKEQAEKQGKLPTNEGKTARDYEPSSAFAYKDDPAARTEDAAAMEEKLYAEWKANKLIEEKKKETQSGSAILRYAAGLLGLGTNVGRSAHGMAREAAQSDIDPHLLVAGSILSKAQDINNAPR